MRSWNVARQAFRDIAIALLIVGYAACPIHMFVPYEISGGIGLGQIAISVLVAMPSIVFRCWGILSAAVVLFFLCPVLCH